MPQKIIVNKWDRYDKLTIIEEVERYKSIKRERMVLCVCDCWNKTTVMLSNIVAWYTKSCWCFNKEESVKRFTSKWNTNKAFNT